jgi:hypothetical protein
LQLAGLPSVVLSEQRIFRIHGEPVETKLEGLASYWIFISLYITPHGQEKKIGMREDSRGILGDGLLGHAVILPLLIDVGASAAFLSASSTLGLL